MNDYDIFYDRIDFKIRKFVYRNARDVEVLRSHDLKEDEIRVY